MDPWEKFKVITTSLSVIIIPVVLGYIGNIYTQATKEKEIQARFVELSINILTQKPTDENRNLRQWATNVIDYYSGVKLSDTVRSELREKISIPAEEALERAIFDPAAQEIDREKVAQMKRCWAEAGVPPDTFLVDFMNNPSFEQARKQVAACMELSNR